MAATVFTDRDVFTDCMKNFEHWGCLRLTDNLGMLMESGDVRVECLDIFPEKGEWSGVMKIYFLNPISTRQIINGIVRYFYATEFTMVSDTCLVVEWQ